MFDKTCAVCGGMVADYGPGNGWLHIVSQYDDAPHDVVLSNEPEVGSPERKNGGERQDHLPEYHRGYDIGYSRGYAAALDAARKAVVGMPITVRAWKEGNAGWLSQTIDRDDTLAAIDVLRKVAE